MLMRSFDGMGDLNIKNYKNTGVDLSTGDCVWGYKGHRCSSLSMNSECIMLFVVVFLVRPMGPPFWSNFLYFLSYERWYF